VGQITDFAKAIIESGKIARFLVRVKTSMLPVTSSMPVTITTVKTQIADHAPVGTTGGDIAAAIELCIVRETRTGPMKNSVTRGVKLIMHTKRIVEVRLWFYYIAGFQG
jgi:hypothetical protein